MKTLLTTLTLLTLLNLPLAMTASAAENAKLSLGEISSSAMVEKAVPYLTYTAGDRSWAGGWKSNGFVDALNFDTNTAYTVFSRKEGNTDRLSATLIAEAIRDYFVKALNLHIEEPSATWTAEHLEGFAPDEFARVFVRSHRDNKLNQGGDSITIQVALLPQGEFAVTMSYLKVE